MKKVILSTVALLSGLFSYSQWSSPDGSGNINNTNAGKVGIGTSVPWAKLDVRTPGASAGDQSAINIQNPSTAAYAAVQLSLTTGLDNTNSSGSLIYSQRDNLGTGANLEFWTTDGNGNILPRMVVTDAGNVGINTLDTKGYQLAVNGQAIFTKVVVKPNANWPDYVFQKGYHLPSLDTVEKFILDHHHLTELPSADSIKKEGIDLGNNQTLLLKKVEELTLYLIGQNKKLAAQEQELFILNQQLKEQARRIEELTARGH